MFTIHDLAAGVVVPAVVAAVVLTAAWSIAHRRRGQRESRSWAAALAISLGMTAGWAGLFGVPQVPPGDATDWLMILALPLALLGTAEAWWHLPPQPRLMLSAIAVCVTFWLLARPLLATGHPLHGETGWILAAAIPLAIGWAAVIDDLAARVSAPRLSAILLAAAAPAAVTLLVCGSQRLGQVGGLVAGGLLGTLVAGLWLGTAGRGRGVGLTLAALYGGTLLCGVLYAELNLARAALLIAAPCAAWLVEVSLARRRARRWDWIVELMIVFGLAGSVAAAAGWEFAASQSSVDSSDW